MANELIKEAKAVNKQGDKLLKAKNYQDAVTLYIESVRLAQNGGDRKLAEKFQKELDAALGKRSEEINAKGDSLFKQKKYEEAMGVYQKAIDLLEKAGEIWQKKKGKEFIKELNKSKLAYAKQIKDIAEKHVISKEWQAAITEYNRILGVIKKKVDEKALLSYRRAQKSVYERWADEYNKTGDNFFKEKKYEEAIEAYVESIKLIDKSDNEKKQKAFKKELAKTFEEQAQVINDLGDKLMKEKKFMKASELYAQSVVIANESGNTKLVGRFSKEMEKAFENYAKQINSSGDKLFKEKKYEAASKIYEESVDTAEQSKKPSLIKNFRKEYYKSLEKWAAEVNKQGDGAMKEKKFNLARKLYNKSVEIVRISSNAEMIRKYTAEYHKACLILSREVNKEGDQYFKAKQYEKAYDLYDKSVKLADIAGDKGKVKAFSKERNKALSKMSD
jgi:tetratricopeptide (TPR) repeat protein